MNERLKELANQAWRHADDNSRDGDGTHGWLYRDKFAELIVRQCAEVGVDSVEDGDDLDAIMKRVHNNILKHFGVKE